MSEAAGVAELIELAQDGEAMSRDQIVRLLETSLGEDREALFRAADTVRKREVGDGVLLRGIIEFSNCCERDCLYCGLRRSNLRLGRYRMTDDEILATARRIREAGVGTVVLQSGEDSSFTGEALGRLIAVIRRETGLIVTLSVGERTAEEYRIFREAGARRYLLKFETAAPDLYRRLRPGCRLGDRIACLKALADLGYEVGTGNMVGLPGQSLETLADDLLLIRELRADMLGIGPFLPHADTPLAGSPAGDLSLTLKVLAVARLLRPKANIPATTALGTLDPGGRLLALQAGANVVMPDFTPPAYRGLYEIYPGRNRTKEATDLIESMKADLSGIGRTIAGAEDGKGKAGHFMCERRRR